jgi:hypothetical protein
LKSNSINKGESPNSQESGEVLRVANTFFTPCQKIFDLVKSCIGSLLPRFHTLKLEVKSSSQVKILKETEEISLLSRQSS